MYSVVAFVFDLGVPVLSGDDHKGVGTGLIVVGGIWLFLMSETTRNSWWLAPVVLCFVGFGMRVDGNKKLLAEEKARQWKKKTEQDALDFVEFCKKAKEGDLDAAMLVGDGYAYGKGTEQNRNLAGLWYYHIAQTGNPIAMFKSVDYILERDIEIENRNEVALRFLEQAVMNGVSGSPFALESMKRRANIQHSDEYIAFKSKIKKDQLPRTMDYIASCESEPEKLLLASLIKIGKLTPNTNNSLNGNFEVKLQYKIDKYRVDFLMNDWLIVEVDGKAYHSNDESFVKDRIRDQDLMLHGFTTSRFPASQIYKDADEVAVKVYRIVNSHQKSKTTV